LPVRVPEVGCGARGGGRLLALLRSRCRAPAGSLDERGQRRGR
jgi:hypothetical protein